jgi:hypothetical protein
MTGIGLLFEDEMTAILYDVLLPEWLNATFHGCITGK